MLELALLEMQFIALYSSCNLNLAFPRVIYEPILILLHISA